MQFHWGGDVGHNADDGEGPRQFPVQGREEDNRKTTSVKEGRDMDIPTAGGGSEGGRNGGDTDINYPEAEYGQAIYCNAADSGPMRAGHPAARHAGVSAVLGTDGYRPRGSARKGVIIKGGSGAGVRGRDGWGSGRRRRGGVPGSERVQWSGLERGGG